MDSVFFISIVIFLVLTGTYLSGFLVFFFFCKIPSLMFLSMCLFFEPEFTIVIQYGIFLSNFPIKNSVVWFLLADL